MKDVNIGATPHFNIYVCMSSMAFFTSPMNGIIKGQLQNILAERVKMEFHAFGHFASQCGTA